MLSKHFGSRISYLRSVKGIAQYELAQKAGLTSQYLGRIERGLVSPSFQVIENICSALHTHPANLFLSCNPELLYQQSTGILDPGFGHCFGTTPTWIGVWTSHGLRSPQIWSSSVYAMLGYKPYSVAPTQRRFMGHVHPDHRRAVKDFLLSAAAGDSAHELHFLFFRKQGVLRIGLAHADQGFSDEAEDRFFQLTLLDVTEWRLLEDSLIINRRELEEHVQRRSKELSSAIDRYQRELSRREELEMRLRQSEQKYRQIVEVADEGIRVLDVHNRIVFINSKTERMFGYTAEELLGRDLMKFIHPLEKAAALQRDMERRQGRSERYVCRQMRKNGKEFWTLTSATPIYDNLGEYAGSVAMITDITELKTAQEELRRLHARLIEAQKAAGLGFWEWDGRTKALLLSDELRNILAIEPRQCPDSFSACRKFIFPEDWPRFRKTVKDSWRHKKSYDLELRVLRSDQNHRHVIARGHPLIEDDSLTGFFGTILDVTHLRHVEHDLEQKRQALNTYFSAALDMFCVIDEDDRFVLANPAWEDILGYAPLELLGRRYQEFMHTEDLQNISDTATMLSTQSNTSRFLHKNGTYHWLEWKAVRHDGHWYASARDTTEKQHMLEALERSETRFRLAMDVAKEGIWDWDILSGNVYYSPGYFFMLGYTEMEFHGHVRTWKDLIHPEDSERTLIANQQCIDGLVDSFQIVYRMRAKDGTWKWIMGTGRAVQRDDHGIALRMLGTHVDVTAFKQIQLDLVAAKTVAETANRAKSVFLATMSHEIRTPLSGIMGTLEMLLEDNPDAHLKNPLEMVLNASRSLLHILNDILDLAKIEAGKLRIIPRTVNLSALIRSNMELFSFQAQKKNLKMSLDLRPHTPETVFVDPVRLGQVLRNLISNAVKFTRNGVVHVVVDTQKVKEGHIELQFSVEDSGVGLNPEFMSKIFEAFSQDNPIDQEETGSGLGLTICQMLVSSMGGRIDVRNNPDKGCTFFFTIQAEAPSGRQRITSATGGGTGTSDKS